MLYLKVFIKSISHKSYINKLSKSPNEIFYRDQSLKAEIKDRYHHATLQILVQYTIKEDIIQQNIKTMYCWQLNVIDIRVHI